MGQVRKTRAKLVVTADHLDADIERPPLVVANPLVRSAASRFTRYPAGRYAGRRAGHLVADALLPGSVWHPP